MIIFMEPTTGIEPVNLILTKDVLYLLSYVGLIFAYAPHKTSPPGYGGRHSDN